MLQRAHQVLFALLVLILGAAAPAMAIDPGYGTPAWSRSSATLYEGPASNYRAVGAMQADRPVTVYRCSVTWCVVGNNRPEGWTQIRYLNFGVPPARLVKHPDNGPGQVCLFEGRNYTGASLCIGPHSGYSDLLLQQLDNRYTSIRVEGNVSAAVCRDRDFQSYCERVTVSQPVMNRHLVKGVSAIWVY
jgi:hypothetical protein